VGNNNGHPVDATPSDGEMADREPPRRAGVFVIGTIQNRQKRLTSNGHELILYDVSGRQVQSWDPQHYYAKGEHVQVEVQVRLWKDRGGQTKIVFEEVDRGREF